MGWAEGTSVLITGGGSGLGRALVDRFLAEGAKVTVLERSPEKAAALPGEVTGVVGDVTKWKDNVEAVAAAVDTFGRLDTFIGNAGVWDFSQSLVSTDGERLCDAFDELFRVNVMGYLLGARAAVEPLL